MKKIIYLLTTCSFVLLLGACNDVEVDGDMTLEDIMNGSISAMEELNSYAMEMEMEQTIDLSDDESMTMNMSSVSEVHQDPMILFQTISMDMLGETLSYESYFSEEHGFFMEDPMMGGWMKYPDSLVTEIIDIETQMSPEEQLKPLMEYITDVSLSSDDDFYTLNLAGEDVDMQAFFEEINGMFGEGMDELETFMPDMTIDELQYEIVIDKETLYQTATNVHMVLTMEMLGETLSTTQNIKMKMSKFNEIESLVIPEDVINNAVEMSETDLFGF
ncbi:DUF6612 family protein [Evansella sp. AB-rgal1]|uniref:DUF6612 family protein n=1 Tax=Evansella sp. AB-rgal1 TaxID=3242696 RepID=UPI00359D76D8